MSGGIIFGSGDAGGGISVNVTQLNLRGTILLDGSMLGAAVGGWTLTTFVDLVTLETDATLKIIATFRSVSTFGTVATLGSAPGCGCSDGTWLLACLNMLVSCSSASICLSPM